MSRSGPQRESGSRRIRVLVLFCLVIILGIFAFSRFSRYHDLTELRDHGGLAVGTVTKVDSHGQVTYTFDVFGKSFTGQDSPSPGDGGQSASTLHSGSAVAVIFDPADPRSSVIGNPESRIVTFEVGIAATVGVVFIIGVAAIYAFFFMGGKKAASAWKR